MTAKLLSTDFAIQNNINEIFMFDKRDLIRKCIFGCESLYIVRLPRQGDKRCTVNKAAFSHKVTIGNLVSFIHKFKFSKWKY